MPFLVRKTQWGIDFSAKILYDECNLIFNKQEEFTMKTLPVAVQVYSVRDDAARDFKGTMQKLKDMGYEGVELAGLYDMKPAEVKAILEEVGLVPLSAHVPFQ